MTLLKNLQIYCLTGAARLSLTSIIAAVFIGLLLPSLLSATLFAQNYAATKSESEFKNLKILPHDISEEDLMSTMRKFSFALGMRCSSCHVRDTTGSRPKFVYEADDKNEKKRARIMMRLVNEINALNLERLGIPEDKLVKVECATCHRGQRSPRMIEDVLMASFHTGGIDSLIAKYKSLREIYYGSHTFNFGQRVLNEIGKVLHESGESESALQALALNLEFNPGSSWCYQSIAQVYIETGDSAKAISNMQSAVKYASSDDLPWYQRQLDKFTDE